jgi:ACR3 family arsenite transporter
VLLVTLESTRDTLERNQVAIYFATIVAALAVAWAWPGSWMLEPAINPALALMLFVTFLQVPLAQLGNAFRNVRFLMALAVGNFIAVPLP